MANNKFNNAGQSGGKYRLFNAVQQNVPAGIAERNEKIFFVIRVPYTRPVKHLTFIYSLGIFVMLSFFLHRNHTRDTGEQRTFLPGISTGLLKDTGIFKVVRLAEAFKATLKDDQLSVLQLAYAKKDAVRWSNFPQAFSRPNRVGLSLGSLNPTQLSAAKALMASVLAQGSPNEGYDELEGILAADDYFGQTTGQTNTFGPGNYYIAFLGKPGTTALWELQFGGHHFAFANTYDGGKITGATPSFRGVEPMAPVTANGRKYEPIEQERAAFSNIIGSLNTAQTDSARLSNTFNDILLGPGRDGVFPKNKQGLSIGKLNSKQQKQVTEAIALYVNDLDAATAKLIMAKYTAELGDTYLSYSGSGTMNKANDYVRLDGPSIWIEYSVQPSRDFPNTTHPHSVWRDRKSDYGGN